MLPFLVYISAIIVSVVFVIIPIALSTIVLIFFNSHDNKERRLMLYAFIWGLLGASMLAFFLNNLSDLVMLVATRDLSVSNRITSVWFTPLIEEMLKGFVLLYLFDHNRERLKSFSKSVIFAILIGFGFAASENVSYLFISLRYYGPEAMFSIVLPRLIIMPFLHAVLTSFTAVGFFMATRDKKKFIAPAAGFLAAVLLHSSFNQLSFATSNTGAAIRFILGLTLWASMFFLLHYIITSKEKSLKKNLTEEVSLGNMTEKQLEEISTLKGYVKIFWDVLKKRKETDEVRLYELCSKLSEVKEALSDSILTPSEEIDFLRIEVRKLSRKAFE